MIIIGGAVLKLLKIWTFFALIFLGACKSSKPQSASTEPDTICNATSAEQQCPEGGLEQWLSMPRGERPVLASQPFAQLALSATQARSLGAMLLQDHQTGLEQEFALQWQDRQLQYKGFTMPFFFQRFGDTEFGQRSLFISMHGGGGTTADVNDGQYVNQQHLYDATMVGLEGIYLAPRAPTDASDMWYQDHIDELFSLIIQLAVIFEGVDPNRVYLMGYSAGGDGVYQLAPRMADRWAAAAMMAGHPNAAAPYSLVNTPFAIHVGELDSAYERNLRAAEWAALLDDLSVQYPGYYQHSVEIHAGLGHWMELQDAVALPWMQQFVRESNPLRIHWQQTTQARSQLYWLSIPPEQAVEKERITVAVDVLLNRIDILDNYVEDLTIWLSDSLLDLDSPITVTAQGSEIFSGRVERSLQTIYQSVLNRGDANLVYSARIDVFQNSVVNVVK